MNGVGSVKRVVSSDWSLNNANEGCWVGILLFALVLDLSISLLCSMFLTQIQNSKLNSVVP
uniref:Bm1014 n=1 Tax=Brugia malayi TaxID=6279 RepID=A0A1I9G5W9_BRUMA|nr:Bm1014 [Brugia malayi]